MPADNTSVLESSIKEQLRVEFEATCRDFHRLLADVPEEMLDATSLNPDWTIREMIYHMSLAPRNIKQDVRLIRHLKWVPKPPVGLFNRLNSYFTKRGARDLDKTELAAKYDEAHTSALAVLESIKDEEWAFSVQYPDWDPMLSGQVTMERLLHYIRLHFDTHAEEIRSILNSER